MKSFVDEDWIHMTLDETFLPHTVSDFFDAFHISKKQRYLMLQRKQLLCNGSFVSLDHLLQPHDILSVYIEASDQQLKTDATSIQVVYEDDVILIVNKPSGLLIHEDGSQAMTLSNRVQHYQIQHGISTPVRPIHRLDKDTTGLVVFCKLPFFQPYLDDALANKQLNREYIAAVDGIWNKKDNFKIELPLARDRHHAKKMRVASNGKYACTYITCLTAAQNYSLLHCRLLTGRTHQIRVHLAHLHHPILSDPLYGVPDKRIQRLALHAFQLTMLHPITQEKLKIKIPLPDDMKSLCPR